MDKTNILSLAAGLAVGSSIMAFLEGSIVDGTISLTIAVLNVIAIVIYYKEDEKKYGRY